MAVKSPFMSYRSVFAGVRQLDQIVVAGQENKGPGISCCGVNWLSAHQQQCVCKSPEGLILHAGVRDLYGSKCLSTSCLCPCYLVLRSTMGLFLIISHVNTNLVS